MPASIVHEGWATKQGSKVKNWKRRYFVLRKDNTLSYYADTKDSAFSVSKAKVGSCAHHARHAGVHSPRPRPPSVRRSPPLTPGPVLRFRGPWSWPTG